MRFYNITMQGKLLLEKRNSDPVFSSNDIARIYFNTADNSLKVVGNTGIDVFFTSNNISELVDAVNNSGDVEAATFGGQPPSYYLNAGNMNAGTLPAARLTGSYNISITGNAATATTANNATNATNAVNADNLNNQPGSFYRNASNMNSGILPTARLSGTYNISITGTAVYA